MRHAMIVLMFLLASLSNAATVGTTLTYQGSLEVAGAPANGSYDFTFQLFTPQGAVASALYQAENVSVVGGVFTVNFDFGPAFDSGDRQLAIGVRSGSSTGSFTRLSPDVPINAVPAAQFSNDSDYALVAQTAIGVQNGSIDEVDLNTGAVSTRTLANGAISEVKLGTDAVSSRTIDNGAVAEVDLATGSVSSRAIAGGAVGEPELATGAVSTRTIASGAVTATQLGSNSVSVAKILGANYTSPNNLTDTIAANSCDTFDVGVSGGFEPGDWVVLDPTTTFPANVLVMPMQVVATNLVKIRFCNVGNSSVTLTNQGIRMLSFR